MNLLIADDELTIRRGLLSLPWTTVGIGQIFEAENGLRAKEILGTEQVDIIISDIRMPGLSGLELSEYVKEFDLDCSIILLTGFSEFEYAQAAVKNQVADYLLKPLRPKDILEAVSRAMEQLKKRRYEEQIVQQHEADLDGIRMEKQVSRYFRGIDGQLMTVLLDMAENYPQDISLNFFFFLNRRKNIIRQIIRTKNIPKRTYKHRSLSQTNLLTIFYYSNIPSRGFSCKN